MSTSVAVLGAGMIGTCTALHLQQRGYQVVLIDRTGPGKETSFGNAGIIQREAVEPHAFPREASAILAAALARNDDVRYHWNALPRVLPRLWQYYANSAPVRYAPIAQAYSKLIECCLSEHQALITAAGAEELIRREGFYFAYRSPSALAPAIKNAEHLQQSYGVQHRVLDGQALASAEPALQFTMAGAIHWLEPWSVGDPGNLVERYAELFVQAGGKFVADTVLALAPDGIGWQVRSAAGTTRVEQVVVALGPWSDALIRTLGYHYPLFIKRGYHQHYQAPQPLQRALLDAERGYVLAPMRRGLRMTTGAEFARLDAPPTPLQLHRCATSAREIIDLGPALAEPPWLGNRPCTADMLPIMGAAPRHRGLWFNFGHAHQGFTLGPVAGRLLAELIEGRSCWIDPAPYSPSRLR